MKRAWGSFAVAAFASGALACSMLKLPGAAADGGQEAAVGEAPAVAEAGAAAPGAAEAVNASEMTRYPDEKPVDHAPITAASEGQMRTQAGGGDLVIVLKKGTEVAKIAEHETFYLVLADDPKDATKKLMGWASESVFGGPASHRGEPEFRGDGGGPAPHGAADAGTKPGPVGPVKPLDVKRINNACPPGYAACGAECRMTCKTEAECGLSTAKCSGGFCLGPGAAPCAR